MGKKLKTTQKRERHKKKDFAKTNSSLNYDLSNFQKIITNEIALNDQKFKDAISEKMKNNKNCTINLNIDKISESYDSTEMEYSKKYSRYLKEELNSKIILMILKYIKESKIFQDEQKNDFNFIFEFIIVIKNLFFNEFELSTLALFLDEIGWTTWQDFYFISLTVKNKTLSDKNFSLLINILEKYNKDFKSSFDLWSKNSSKIIMKLEKIDLTEINKKFSELSKNIYDFNKKKFIDYNNLVNKILSNVKINKVKNNNEEDNNPINSNQIYSNQNSINFYNNSNKIENSLNIDKQNSLGIQSRNSSNLFIRSQNSIENNNISSAFVNRNLLDLNKKNSSLSFKSMSGNLDLNFRGFSSNSFNELI